MIGQTIAHYRVTAKLGAGGMGVVYRATDVKLGRDVALKVLPEGFAADAQRMQRFQREAHVLASLNHSNIAAIYGLEHQERIQALAMELVEGPTLAERIAQGAMPPEEALPIAKQIAEALEYAHEKGIIHRDLKPANIKLTPSGQAKVLDFGLAKALSEDPVTVDVSASPTLSLAATKAGIILGTAAYMSPEQAKGKSVDRRSDIWSFGVVLFEMLTGRQMYTGETVSETMAQVILNEPGLDALPGNTPAQVRQLLRRCLMRDPNKRLQAIGEARIVLEEPHSNAPELSPISSAPDSRASRRKRLAMMAAGVFAIAAVSSVLGWNLKPRPREIPLRKFEFPVEQLQVRPEAVPKISPDGTRIVYATTSGLWIRGLDALDSRKLTEIPSVWHFTWSPDGQSVAYISQNKLWKVPASGGSPQVISVVPAPQGRGSSLDWGPDGRIVVAVAMPQTGLVDVSAQGADPVSLLQPQEGVAQDYHDARALPDGRGLLYIIDRGQGAFDTIAVLANSQPKSILQMKGDELNSPAYSPSGHIVFHRNTTNPGIWAVPFSLAKLETTGEPFLVAAQGKRPDVSADGTLTYIRSTDAAPHQLVWLDRTGKALGTVGDPKTEMFNHRLSPNGRTVSATSESDVWVLDVARNSWSRLTFTEKANEISWGWLPDGKRVIYAALDENGTMTLWLKQADGTGLPQKLVPGVSGSVSADGNYLVYVVPDLKTSGDLWAMPLAGDRKPFPVLQTPASEHFPSLSPSGKYLLYQSNESGETQVYVRPFPSGEGKWQVSTSYGFRGRWSRAGDKIYYMDRSHFLEVDVTLRPSFALGKPRPLFNYESTTNLNYDFDPAPDGKRFLAVQDVGAAASAPTLVVVQNWFAEFKDKQKK